MIELSLIVFMIFVSVIVVVVATQERDNGERMDLSFLTNGTDGLVTVWNETKPILTVMIRINEDEPEGFQQLQGVDDSRSYIFTLKECLESRTELQRKLIDMVEESPASIFNDEYRNGFDLEIIRMIVIGLADHHYSELTKDRIHEVHNYLLKVALI